VPRTPWVDRTSRHRAANCNNGPWLRISSIGRDWACVICGYASRARRSKLRTRPYAPRRRHTRIDDSLPRTQGMMCPHCSSLVGLAVGAIAGAVALRFASGPLLGKTFWRIGAAGIFTEAYRLQTHCNSSFVDDYRGAAGIMGAMVGIHGRRFPLSSKTPSQGLLTRCWAPSFQLLTWEP
jgi:hypothetical protein